MERKVRAITPYAEQLVARARRIHSPANAACQGEDWLTAAEASKLSGYSRRQIHNLCDSGFLIEGEDWKQRQPSPGKRQGGLIRIRRSALQKL